MNLTEACRSPESDRRTRLIRWLMMAVDIELGASLHTGSPRLLFAGDYGLNNGYDVAADDGKRFLMVKSSSSTQQMPPNQLTFVVNWFEELKQRVPAK